MPIQRARDGFVSMTDVGGTVRNITSFVDNFTSTTAADELETTVYGASARTFIRGYSSWEGTISGKFDSLGSSTPHFWIHQHIDAAATIYSTLVHAPAGSATGRPFELGTVMLSNYSLQGPFDDIVTWSVDFRLAAGSVALGTY